LHIFNYRMSRPGAAGPPVTNYDDKAKIDEEYMSLMAELGQGKAESGSRPSVGPSRFSSSGSIFERSSAPKAVMGSAPSSSLALSSHSGNPPPPGLGKFFY